MQYLFWRLQSKILSVFYLCRRPELYLVVKKSSWNTIYSFPELHEKWEARRTEERARQEAERAERERIAREEAERKAAEEAKRKEEEERLRREQAEEAGEKEEAGDKEEGEEAGEGEEKAKEEGEEGAATATAAPEAEPKDMDTPELQPSGEDLTLGAGPEEEELVLDSDMPPNTPETEEFKNHRTKFDQDFPQLLSVLKGTNNIEPIAVSVEKETDDLNKEVIRRIEGMCVGTGTMYVGYSPQA